METFVGDTVKLFLDTGIDLSGYTTLRILYKKPDSSVGYWAATMCPINNDRMYYTTDVDDFDVNGVWQLQSYVSDGTDYLHGKWVNLSVYRPIM